MQHSHALRSWIWPFNPTPGSWGGVVVCGQNICYHVAAFNDHILKCWILTYWPHPRVGRGGFGEEGVRVCGQNICYHVATFVIPFNLICNMTCSEKIEFWPFDPTRRDGGMWGEGKNICYHVAAYVISFNLICNSMTMFWKSWILTF